MWHNGYGCLLPNVAMSRGYGWRGGCPAADVPDEDVGSVESVRRILFIELPVIVHRTEHQG